MREMSNFSFKIIILNCLEGVKVQALGQILMLIIGFFYSSIVSLMSMVNPISCGKVPR